MAGNSSYTRPFSTSKPPTAKINNSRMIINDNGLLGKQPTLNKHLFNELKKKRLFLCPLYICIFCCLQLPLIHLPQPGRCPVLKKLLVQMRCFCASDQHQFQVISPSLPSPLLLSPSRPLPPIPSLTLPAVSPPLLVSLHPSVFYLSLPSLCLFSLCLPLAPCCRSLPF